MYLSKFVFKATDDIKVRKLIVNTFIREVILYDNEIVITYNFTDSHERLKITKEQVLKTEKEIETADSSAFSSLTGSYKLRPTAPVRVFITDLSYGHSILFLLSAHPFSGLLFNILRGLNTNLNSGFLIYLPFPDCTCLFCEFSNYILSFAVLAKA